MQSSEALNQLPIVVVFSAISSYFMSKKSCNKERAMALRFLLNLVVSVFVALIADYIFNSTNIKPSAPKDIVAFYAKEFAFYMSFALSAPWVIFFCIGCLENSRGMFI